ncbi:Pre-mRNA splicing, partial [Linderina macrospora]
YLSLPDKSLPPTEVLDMQPLKISELHDPEFEQVYQSEISPMRRTGTFNAIQTQSFHTLYRTDDSVLLGASPGSGKTLAAEIALLRFFKHEALRARADGDEYVRWRAVYIAPFASLVRTRAQEWKRRFASLQGGKNVVVLSGDLSGDLKRIENAHIIVTTPGPWDALSRKWRTRQHHAVREIGLVIADEVHWVGGAGLGSIDDVISGVDHDAGADFVGDQLAATYEIIVSRIRYMAAEIERPIRIVALSVPLANARDVAAWIGAPSSAVFNFPPTLRPVQLDVLIQTSTIPHFASRMAALAAPTYRAVCGDPEGTRRVPESRDPAIVFVPSRRQCRVVAGELLTLAAADGAPTMFLRAEFSMIESVVEQVSDRALREILK